MQQSEDVQDVAIDGTRSGWEKGERDIRNLSNRLGLIHTEVTIKTDPNDKSIHRKHYGYLYTQKV